MPLNTPSLQIHRTSLGALCIGAALLLRSGAAAQDLPILRVEPGGHTARVTKVLFSGDRERNWLISVGEDKAARIWDLDTGRQIRTMRGQIGPDRRGQLFAAAVSDRTLAVAGDIPKLVTEDDRDFASKQGYRQAFRFFNLVSGKIARKPQTWHKGVVTSLAFSKSGERLASASRDSTVLVWNFYEREDPKELKGHQGGVNDVAFNPADDKLLASAGDDGTVRLWDWAVKKASGPALALGSPVLCIAWAPDGRTLLAGTKDGKVHFFDPASGKPVNPAAQTNDSVTAITVSPDGTWFATGGGATKADFKVCVWSLPDGRVLGEFRGHAAAIQSLAASPDGRFVASADRAGVIRVWDPQSRTERWQLGGQALSNFSVAWSPDGRRLAWGQKPDGKADLTFAFLLDSGLPGLPPRQNEGWVFGQTEAAQRKVSIAPDRRSVAVTENGRQVGSLTVTMPNDEIWSAVITPKGDVIVGSEFELRMYDPSLNKRGNARFVGHDGAVRALSVSPDGRFVASASEDKSVRIWSLQQGGNVEPLLSLVQTQTGQWIAWTPRGYYAASPSGDEIIGWHVNRGDNTAADFYTAFQFRHKFYRPDAVRKVVAAGDVLKALQMADAEGGQKTDVALSIQTEIARTPSVEIVEVGPVPGVKKDGAGYVSDRADVTVLVRVTNADAASTVRVQVNHPSGSRRLTEAKPGTRPNEWVLPARLVQGSNALVVVATNQTGESPPSSVGVRFDAPAASRKPSTLHVLAIGVKEYADPKIPGLRYADADAERLSALYKAQQGRLFDRVEVRTLLNRQATRQAVQDQMNWLETMSPEDSAIVFISSHGFRGSDVAAGGSSEEAGAFYFAPTDTKLAQLKQTGIRWSEITNRLRDLRAKSVVLILDHCFSGGVDFELARSYAAIEAKRALVEGSILTLTASTEEEESWEDPAWGHGAFTYALLQALNGQVPQVVESEGLVMLDALALYVHREVPRMVHALKGPEVRQTPNIYRPPGANVDVPLAKVR